MIKTAILLAVVLAVPSTSYAQGWPNRHIEIILPTAAGSGPDVTMRSYTDRIAKGLGQSIIINNRPGASGAIAAQAAARSQPDGYTFFLASPAQLIFNKYVLKDLPYDPDTDFVPVSLLNRAPFIVLTNPRLSIKSLGDLVAYNKTNRGNVFVSHEGATGKATAAYLNKVMDLEMTLVPYVNAVKAITDLVGGSADVHLHVQGSALALPFAKDGRLQALAVTSSSRFEQLPDVPAMSEVYPSFGNFETWLMLLAPKGTPDAVIRRMSSEIGRVAQIDEMKQLFRNLGVLPADSGSPEAAVKFLREQNLQVAKMAAAAALKPE
jgi:tripartite-type tricarboxylate transporter receptor subunit TctC